MVASIKPYVDELGLGDGRMLISGEWVAAADGATWSHTHPATGEQVASFPVAAAVDVDRAVRAARAAFDEGPWPRARAKERGRALSAAQTEVPGEHVLDLCHVVTGQVVHEFARNVRDVNSAYLVDQDPGSPASDDGFRPEHGLLGTR